jgi:hypothetical protein
MITKDKLFWGKPCRRHGHQKEDGTNLRHIDRTCMMCKKGTDLGFEDQDALYTYLINPKPPKRTEEEKAALRVAASMRWNAKNKDKVKVYAKKYNAKPARKAIQAAKAAEWWKNLSAEDKLIYSQKTYANFKKKNGLKEAEPRIPVSEEELRARHERRLAKERERYAALTPEQKAIMLEKQRARKQRKKDKDGS